ncbi:MAG: S8 family serine peptidase [Bacillota bacterium]
MDINIRTRQTYKLFFVILYLIFSTAQFKEAAATDFNTAEYQASTGLDIINAAKAYELGYTGQGICLGICDLSIKFSHPEFVDKTNSYSFLSVPESYDWQQLGHGTRVAGVMAAARNNIGMMGVAFDANIISGCWFDVELYKKTGEFVKTFRTTYDAFNKLDNVKIINNSWGIAGPGSLYMEWEGADKNDLLQYYKSQDINVSIFDKSINEYDKVLVFAAGNSGHTSAHAFALLPYIVPSTVENFLVATMIDPANFNKEANSANWCFLGVFSDLAKYVEENTVAAPGWDINSTVAAGDTYGIATGTSFSAPHVTATAGLIQQAFPYMNGKQIVDTILSSANKSFSLPEYSLTLQTDYPSGQVQPVISLNLYYFGDKPDQAVVNENLTKIFYDKKATWESSLWPGITLAEFLSFQQTVYDNVPREMLFGQGLLDTAAAVRGPAILNARRMDNANFSAASEYRKNQALFKIDTQGYSSVWSNDIAEKRAGLLAEQTDPQYADLQAIYRYYQQGDQLKGITTGQEYIDEYNEKVIKNCLMDLPVGLLKSGTGVLALTGKNTYSGSSVAADGILQIDGSVSGDAFSVENGIVAGSGTISGSLYNYSVVQAGSYGEPGIMTVQGNLESTGMIAVAANSSDYGRIIVNGSATVAGGSFMAVPGSVYRPEYIYTAVITANSLTGDFLEAPFTGMLSAVGSKTGTTLGMTLVRANNLGNLSARQSKAYDCVQAIFDNSYGQAQQRQLDRLYCLGSMQASSELTAVYGGAQMNQAAMIQRNVSVQAAVDGRLEAVLQGKLIESKKPIMTGPQNLANVPVFTKESADAGSLWVNVSKGWGTVNPDGDLPGFSSQATAVIVGGDKELNSNWCSGLTLVYVNNQTSSTLAQTQSPGMNIGTYAGYSDGLLSGRIYLDYGKQNNSATRAIPYLGMQADSSYGSQTVSMDAVVRYNLVDELREAGQWQLSPYLSADVVWYDQSSYQENGAGVLDQIALPFQNTYSTAGAGLAITKAFGDDHQLLVSLGYKGVIGGNNSQMTVTYSGAPDQQVMIGGNTQDSNYAVMGINYQGKISENWSADAQLWSELGSYSSYLSADLSVNFFW